MKNYLLSHFDSIDPVRCPCGFSRRAHAVPGNDLATMHLVEIQQDSRTHYHKKMTEIYLVLEGEGHIELDGELIPIRPMTTIMIQPGCRHRAIGKLKIVNVAIPAFDETDEWFD